MGYSAVRVGFGVEAIVGMTGAGAATLGIPGAKLLHRTMV
jgi:hypothetical protein